MGLKKELIEQQRSYIVAKGNDLITKSRYSLTTEQNKLLLYMVSKIKPDDEPETEYTIAIADIIRIFGYSNAGEYYTRLKQDVKKIADVSVWIETEPGTEELFRWIDRTTIKRNSGEFTITFHSSIRPFLFELREKYTSYNLTNVLCLSHKYAIRLYEYLLAMRFRGEFEVSIDEIKKRMDVTNETYNKMANFKARVFEPAIDDINNYTELNIEYTYIKQGKKIAHIAFKYHEEDGVSYTMAERLRKNKIDPERRRATREFKKEIEQRRKARGGAENLIQGKGIVTAQMTIDELAEAWDVTVKPDEGSATT